MKSVEPAYSMKHLFYMTLIVASLPVLAQNQPSTPYWSYAMLVPVEQATLASQFTGEIEAISVRDGDPFAQGQVLVKFDCEVKEVELEKAKAEVESTGIAWKSAQELDRLKSVSKVEVAKARVDHQRAKIEVKRLETELKQCTIAAPFSGKVVEVVAYAHEDVTPGQPLLKIINDKELEIKLFVSSTWLSWLKIGTEFKVHFDEMGNDYQAVVTKINPPVDTASQTIDLYGKYTADHPQLISGMSGKAYFMGPKQ